MNGTTPSSPAGLPAPPVSIPPSPSTSPQTMTAHAFPADWLCSSCGSTHSVLSILEASQGEVEVCPCGNPTLQAVYDQFGSIFLYWRNDPAIVDLRNPDSAQEAAWRVAEAAGGSEILRRELVRRAGGTYGTNGTNGIIGINGTNGSLQRSTS
jgi:hypothetical protein